MEPLDLPDIQGLLLSAYGKLGCAAYLLLRVTDTVPARRWLTRIALEITPATEPRAPSINLGLTYDGMRKLGLDQAALASFPEAFRDGMASERRSRILGDTDESTPSAWRWGGPSQGVDILLMLFTDGDAALDALVATHRAGAQASGLAEVVTLTGGRRRDSKDTVEHFGFNDGIGQPAFTGGGSAARQFARTGHVTELAPGEFILGYADVYGRPPPSPTAVQMPTFGRNGSYLVFRQLAQDVAGFWQFLDRATRDAEGQSDAVAQTRLAAKIVGRWPSGAPLVTHPDSDPAGGVALIDENDFAYAGADAQGFACPIGAHIRRANPRDSLGPEPATALRSTNRHRLLRRGRSYGDRPADKYADDGAERGLLFLCLNASIERQFEFVQQTWINNPVFGGLYRESDPLVGDQTCADRGMTVQGQPVRTRVAGLTRFTTVKGGAYFFLPSLSALRYLGSLTGSVR